LVAVTFDGICQLNQNGHSAAGLLRERFGSGRRGEE
jgi:hypothetical protein